MKTKLCCDKQETYLKAIVNILEVNSTSTKHAEQVIYKKKPTRKKIEKHGTYTKVEKLQIKKQKKKRKKDAV